MGLCFLVLGFDAVFGFVLWVVVTAYPLGVYAFSRIFAGKSAASNAALASAVLLPIYVSAYIFGQLPFLLGTLLALFEAAALARYLSSGMAVDFMLAVSLSASTMAAHHATLIVQPFFILAALGSSLDKNPRVVTFSRLFLFTKFFVTAGF